MKPRKGIFAAVHLQSERSPERRRRRPLTPSLAKTLKTATATPPAPAFDHDAGSHLALTVATAHRRVHDNDSRHGRFVTGLSVVRNAVTPAEWGAMINDDIAPHPIRRSYTRILLRAEPTRSRAAIPVSPVARSHLRRHAAARASHTIRRQLRSVYAAGLYDYLDELRSRAPRDSRGSNRRHDDHA